jgi:hypothetical protein
VLRLDRVVGLCIDDAWYALLAQALATGQGYQVINSPTPGILPLYPPAYSFLLSLVYRLAPQFPQNVTALKLVSVAAMLGVGWASYYYFKREREWPSLLSLLSALTVTLTPSLVFLATSTLMSECVFMLAQLLALLALEACVRADQSRRAWQFAALSGALAAAAFLTRSAAATLIVAAVIYLLKERRKRAALIFAACVILLAGPWTIYARLHAPTKEQRTEQGGVIIKDYQSYFWQERMGDGEYRNIGLGELPERVWRNAGIIAKYNTQMLFAPLFVRSSKLSGEEALVQGTGSIFLSLLLSALLILGAVIAVRRRITAVEIAVALSLLLTVLWPWEPFRFVLPLTPFLFGYLLTGVGWLREVLREKLQIRMSPAPWAALMIVTGAVLALQLFDHIGYLRARDDKTAAEYIPWNEIFTENEAALDWLRQRTPADAVIATKNPALVYLYTGRKSISGDTPAANWENWKRLNVRYLAYISTTPVGNPNLAEGRFTQAYRSNGPLRLRIMDLGPKETRQPWGAFTPQAEIKFESLQ